MITLDGTLGITSPAETVQGALTTTSNTILGDVTTDTLTVGVTGIVKDASGNVGIGTANPKKRLTVIDATSAATTPGTNPILWIGGGTANVSTLSEIGFTYGFTSAYGETNAPTTIGYQLTSGSGFTKGALTFCTRDVTTDTAPTERMRIDSSGNLLVGNTGQTVTEKFGVTGTGTYVAAFTNNTNTSGYNVLRLGLSPNGGNTSSYFLHGNTNAVGNWYLFGNGTTSFTSDQRLKKNIETTRGGYAQDLCKLRVVKYNWWKDDDETPKELGLIAQEVAQVFPNLVMDDPSRVSEDDDTVCKTLKQSVLPFMLLKAIQEQQALITQLQADVATLKALSA